MGGEKKKTAVERVLGLYAAAKKPLKYSVWSLSIAAVLGLAYLFFSLSYLDRVYPNVVVGVNNFDRLTLEQVRGKLTALAAAQTDQKIVLQPPPPEGADGGDGIVLQPPPPEGADGGGEEALEFSPKDIDWQVDIESTANQIFNYGRGDSSRLMSFLDALKSPFIKTRFNPTVRYDAEALSAKISQLTDKVDNPAVDASAELVSDKLVTTAEKLGEVVDEPKATSDTLTLLNGLTGGTVTIEKRLDTPETVLGDVAILNKLLDNLSTAQLTIKWNNQAKKLSRKEIRQLVGFPPTGAEAAPDDATPKVLTARFTTEKVQNYLTSISELTDSPAVEPQLVIKDGQLSIVKNSKEGRIVDLKTSAATILKTLETDSIDSIAELSLKADTPVINENNLATLGIKERIGYGETNMAGSPANRRHNVQNGVSILSSALIKPGEVFSTVGKLGAVDNTTGFLPELVIKENRTTPEFGGGLCQVSTTLFRSILNAGLKVTERQNHSYRVGYYEPPVGLDATIYLPKPDLKFINDTPAHILIQGRVAGNRVIFELWGSSDGRTSSTTTPILSNVIAPGEPIYADTDTLPKGEQKQIEKPHAGATAVVTYTVTRGGQVINKQVFKSIYKVWPARFLVGTNESLPPTSPSP